MTRFSLGFNLLRLAGIQLLILAIVALANVILTGEAVPVETFTLLLPVIGLNFLAASSLLRGLPKYAKLQLSTLKIYHPAYGEIVLYGEDDELINLVRVIKDEENRIPSPKDSK